MKNCTWRRLFFFAFLLIFISGGKLFYSNSYALPEIIQTTHTFYMEQQLREDITFNVDLKGNALLSLKCENEEIDNLHFSLSGNLLTVYQSFFMTLSPKLYEFTLATSAGEAHFYVDVLAPKKADFKEDFSDTQGNNGWYYMYNSVKSGAYSLTELTSYYYMFMQYYYNTLTDLYIGKNACKPYEYKALVLQWRPEESGYYMIDYSITKFSASDSDGISAYTYKNEQLLENTTFIIKPQDFCQNDYTASYKKEVYLSIGDIINFEVNCYIKDISDDFIFDIKISEPYSKVTYQAENTVICHNILNGNSAMPYDNITDGIVEGYYSDENFQQSFDFQQPISQDTLIYIKKGFDFDVTLNGNMLTVDAVKLSGCNYQFWAKTVTDTDENKDNLSSSCGFWNMIQPFSEINSLTVNLATLYKEDGRYHFIVRKKIGGVVSDLYKSFNCDGLSGAKITSVKVNGELFNGKAVAVNKDEPFNISLSGSGENLIYSVICDNQITHCGGGGDFDIDISNFNDGFHIFTLKAESHNYCDQTELKIYIYGDYNEYTPVINSLSGKLLHSGLTKYTMQLSCADGSNISAESLNDLETVLYSENTKLSPSFQYVNGVLNAVFTIDYHNKHGIYYISGSVKYCGKVTDTIVYYYKEQARAATLYQYCDKTVIQVGETFNIRAEGSIEGEQDGLLYAYYREDANGWQMIRDYSYNSNLIWTPLRPGAYIIQVRIKGEGEGSWEKALSKTYTVTGGSLSGEISLSIINYAAGLEQTQMAAGTPYLLSATYSGAEDVLFMYLVSSENIKTKYLCNYSVSGDYIFIPNKPDNYVITVRVINAQNFSYKDMSENINIFSVI